MIGWLRAVLMTVLFALLGAAAGRLAAELRRREREGDPPAVDLRAVLPRSQDIVPGLVAALRVRDRPWSFLRIPPWGAAFAVSFVVAAIGRELQPFAREQGGEGASYRFGQPEGAPGAPAAETVLVDGKAVDGVDGGPSEGFAPSER